MQCTCNQFWCFGVYWCGYATAPPEHPERHSTPPENNCAVHFLLSILRTGDCVEYVADIYVRFHQIEKQTVAFNIRSRENFKKTTRARMSVWQAIELLNTLVDDSDPDVRVLIF